MELRVGNRLRTASRLIRPEGKKEDAASAASPRPQTDRFVLSRQIAEQLEAQNRLLMDLARKEEKKPFVWDMMDGCEETGNSEADALGEQMKTMERCHKIAARIMRGDKVPPQDERYLMLNDPEGYKLVLAMRAPKRNPKKWESVLEEEGAETGRSSGEETVSCEGTGEASGGDGGSSGESE
ncbi:MAG: hypothetical protein K2P37_13725 [Oscillospiraceae bacterium]|nr:hypothetical protein [Oscillospiraceae bacterium]